MGELLPRNCTGLAPSRPRGAMKSFIRKLRWQAQRRDKNDELRAEIRFHLEEEAEERLERGLTENDARRKARWEFGNVSVIEDATRRSVGDRKSTRLNSS